MTKRLRTLDDLRDSALLYSKNPPKLMTAIVVVILISLVVAVAVAETNKKTEVIRSAGVIQSENKVYIMSSIGGEIDCIYVSAGQYVEVGDNLITIGTKPLNAQLDMYTNLADYYWNVLGGYVLMRDRITNYDIERDVRDGPRNQNPFDADSERFMYLVFEGFLEYMSNITADDNNTLQENRQLALDESLMECERVIREYEPTYKQVLYQKEYTEILLNESTIRAKTSGIIHFETVMNEGMVVSTGALLFSISNPIDGDKALVRLQIPVGYRPHLHEGLLVQMDVVGYPSSTYGKLEGQISWVSSDSSVDPNGNAWFTVEVTIDEAVLKTKAGSIHITNGMMVMASIVYEESTWLDWILRGIGFK